MQSACEWWCAWLEMGMRGAAHRVTSKTGCIKLLHYADMVLHDADQVEIQTIDDAILKEFFWAVNGSRTPHC